MQTRRTEGINVSVKTEIEQHSIKFKFRRVSDVLKL